MQTHVEAFAELPHARRAPDAAQARPRLGAKLEAAVSGLGDRLRGHALFLAGSFDLGRISDSGCSGMFRIAFRNRILKSVDLKMLL